MKSSDRVVCDTAKVRFFKQITTLNRARDKSYGLFAILQKYDFSSKSQLSNIINSYLFVVCDTAKVRFFKQITTLDCLTINPNGLFAILQKYDFSSKSQLVRKPRRVSQRCLRYCKSTIFQANHNKLNSLVRDGKVVCDTAKVRFFKQITTQQAPLRQHQALFAILQKYDFSSKSQHGNRRAGRVVCCLRYCKSTIFQANHNAILIYLEFWELFAILQKYDFSSKSQHILG